MALSINLIEKYAISSRYGIILRNEHDYNRLYMLLETTSYHHLRLPKTTNYSLFKKYYPKGLMVVFLSHGVYDDFEYIDKYRNIYTTRFLEEFDSKSISNKEIKLCLN